MATFTFRPLISTGQITLQITKSGERNVNTSISSSNVGCGGTIIWKEMASVPIPPQFKQSSAEAVSTRDIDVLPTQARSVRDRVNNDLAHVGVTFGNNKPN